MRCEDCRALVEEYADGELDDRLARNVGAHLSSCPDCSARYEELTGGDAFLLQHYRRDLAVSEGAWANVLAGYRAAAAPAATPGFFERLRRSLSPSSVLRASRPALALASACVVLAVVLSLYFVTRTRVNDSTGVDTAGVRGEAPRPSSRAENATPTTPQPTRQPSTTARQEQETLASAPSSSSDGARLSSPSSDRRARRRSAVEAVGASVVLPLRAGATSSTRTGEGGAIASRAAAGVADGRPETARHIEKVQMLLRSFQNRGAGGGEGELDVSFEKQLSRRLLSANVALRRELGERGDLSSEALLGDVEPFLADIAALPDRVLRADARRIEERLRREAVVAALPVYTSAARGAGF